jgi:hypothetical protein
MIRAGPVALAFPTSPCAFVHGIEICYFINGTRPPRWVGEAIAPQDCSQTRGTLRLYVGPTQRGHQEAREIPTVTRAC